MADALVSFLLDQLATVIQDEIQLVVGVEHEINKLIKTFKAIQVVLKDADHKQFKDDLVKHWLEEFKDVAYDVDDILDEWNTEMLVRSQIKGIENAPNDKGKKKVHSFLCSLCSCFRKVGLHHDIVVRIKNIRERVEFIASEKDNYHLNETKSKEDGPERLETSSLIDESVVCGRSFEKDIIISKLLGESDAGSSTSSSIHQEMGLPHPIVISIVGMGGLGKTTLAQLVFNNEQVKNHFEKLMWVCVSDTFDRTRVTQAIIEEAGGIVHNNPECNNKLPEWNKLHNSLSESIMGKRFLLVLDDVWSEDPLKWESLEVALKSGAQGSQILVTTRNKKVARIMNSTNIYDLKILSDYDCWSLLSRIAFVGREKQEQETLNGIGIKIAKKCKGLPLAAKALGSLLRFKRTEGDWQNVLESDIWELEEVENSFLKPALLLSYFDLPSPLKLVFTYCSIFPKGYKMEKNKMIKLWMGQSFLNISGTREDLDLETIGEEYFNNLVLRSFFQDFIFVDGKIYSCKMHDLLHDFAQFLMKVECYSTQMIDDTHFNSKMRHLSLVNQHPGSSFHASIYKAKNLRTFQLLLCKNNNVSLPSDVFQNLRCLRVLCLESSGLESLSSEIGTLIHLRYLDLSDNTKLKKLPESISNLYNLQTLQLEYCESLCKLPDEMWRMINLRHLDVRYCDALTYFPQGFGKLTSLRTLTQFTLSGVTRSCKIQELKDLDHLNGELTISGLGCMKTGNEASEARLKNKNLRVLELQFELNDAAGKETVLEGDMESLILDRMNSVLEGLQPHPKLEELRIWDYLGSKFPSWIADNSILSHLKRLELYECINCTEFPALGRLPSLEVLVIMRMNESKQIGLESYRPSTSNCGGVMNVEKLFPKLKELSLWSMANLEELGNGVAEEEGVEIMPFLVALEIGECPKLMSLPRKLLNLEELKFFYYSPSLSQLPYLPKLKHLNINNSSVARLPQSLFAQLKGLQTLEMEWFPELICMPEEVRHLTNLQKLKLIECDMLGPRCRKGEGEDWNIISHIPNIYIDEEKIQ